MIPAPQLAAARPLLLGHRGASHYAPENTLAAFDLALAHGCDGFEFDVRLTADSVAVICHDPEVYGLPVAAGTYDQLCNRVQRENLMRGRNDLPSEAAALPTLNQVLERYGSCAVLDIELKVEGLELLTLEYLRRYAPQRTCWVSSFLPSVLMRMHELDPAIPLGLICRRRGQLAPWRQLPISALFLHHRLLRAGLIDELHTAGKQVLGWTINGAGPIRAAVDLHLDGILSDDTRLLARMLGSQERAMETLLAPQPTA